MYDKTEKRYLRGSDQQCPKCGSTAVVTDPDKTIGMYGPGLTVCPNCKSIWEPFAAEAIWDKTDPHCSFKTPCNNCAFRPGSPEQADKEKWIHIIQQLKMGGHFYCHKGVPIEAEAEHGFAYPHKTIVVNIDGMTATQNIPDTSKLRLCRGYLNALSRWCQNIKTNTPLDELTPTEIKEINRAQRERDQKEREVQ